MNALIEQIIIWFTIIGIVVFGITPTFGALPVFTLAFGAAIWWGLVAAIQGVGVGGITFFIAILIAAIVLTIGNFTPGVNTTLVVLVAIWASIIWESGRAMAGYWPDFITSALTMGITGFPTTAFPTALLTPVIGPTIAALLNSPTISSVMGGVPTFISPIITTLFSSIYLSSMIPIVGPTTAIVPFIVAWILGIVWAVVGYVEAWPIGLIWIALFVVFGVLTQIIPALIVGIPSDTIAITLWATVLIVGAIATITSASTTSTSIVATTITLTIGSLITLTAMLGMGGSVLASTSLAASLAGTVVIALAILGLGGVGSAVISSALSTSGLSATLVLALAALSASILMVTVSGGGILSIALSSILFASIVSVLASVLFVSTTSISSISLLPIIPIALLLIISMVWSTERDAYIPPSCAFDADTFYTTPSYYVAGGRL